MYDYASVALLGDKKMIAQRHSMSMGDEIYSIDLTGDHTVTQLTFENKHIYDQLTMGKVEERWMKTTDGKQMLTWVIYPPQFDPNKKYPTLLFCCEGGPQSPCSVASSGLTAGISRSRLMIILSWHRTVGGFPDLAWNGMRLSWRLWRTMHERLFHRY